MKKSAGFVLLSVFLFLLCACANGDVNDDSTALSVGEFSVGYHEFRYEYNKNLLSFQKTYAERISNTENLDFSGNLAEQRYNDEMSWADYFINYTASSLETKYLWYADALANGYELTEKDRSDIENQIAYINEYMAENNLTEDDVFGETMTVDEYRTQLEKSLLCQKRYNDISGGFGINYDDCLEYAENNMDLYYKATFYAYKFMNDEFDAPETKAEEFAEVLDNPSEFERYLYESILSEEEKSEYYEGQYLRSGISYDNLNNKISSWFFSAERQYGDIGLFNDGTGTIIVVFISLEIDKYQTVNIRRISVNLSGDDSLPEKTRLENAKIEAESVYSALGDSFDEEAFAEAAKTYSDDRNSSLDGGLVENCDKGVLSTECTEWMFDENRIYGDTAILQGNDGYEILFFIDKGEEAWYLTVKKTLAKENYGEYLTALKEKYPFKRNTNVINRIKN